jgi:hypothetical protein
MGRISHSRCTIHVPTTTSGRILPAYKSRLLASFPTVVSRLAFWHSCPTDGSGLLAIADVVESSTWRAVTTALWISSVDTASAYFHATHSKTSLYKNMLHMFTWLFRIPNTLIYMSFRAQITTRWRGGIRLHRHHLEPDGRIRWQRWRQQRATVVLVLIVFWIVRNVKTCELPNTCVCDLVNLF